MNNQIFDGNVSNDWGGAVCIIRSQLSFYGVFFTDNLSFYDGGALSYNFVKAYN